jgi:hypothetical protein
MYFRPLNGQRLMPPDLNTISRWRRAGYRVRPDAAPRARARIGMAWGGKAQLCELYSIEDCVSIKRRVQQRSWNDPVFGALDELLKGIDNENNNEWQVELRGL